MPQATQERVYAELGKQLNVDPKLLREKLPQLAEQLKRIPEVPPFERANAAFVAKDYKEAEQLASSIADQIRDDPTRRDEAIRALQLASWSAQARFQYADALRHLRAAENLTDRQASTRRMRTHPGCDRQNTFSSKRIMQRRSVYGAASSMYGPRLWGRNTQTLYAVAWGLAVAMDAQGKYDAAANENREIVMVEEKARRAGGSRHSGKSKQSCRNSTQAAQIC